MKLVTDPDRMYAAGAGIRQLTDILHTNMDSIEYLVRMLDGDWQGDAARAYASKIVHVRREFQAMEQFFQEYSMVLMQIVGEHQRLEDELAAMIRNV